MRLVQKVAIITGGGSGIGKAIAAAFVREGAGVVIAGRDGKKLELAAGEIGENCLAVAADVSRAADAQRLAAEAVKRFGRIDVLVNNAAVLLPGTTESISEEDFDQTLSVNVRGLWLMSRAVLPQMRAGGGGAIINIGSVLSTPGARNPGGLCASKRRGVGLDAGHGAGPCGGECPRELHLPGDRGDGDGGQLQPG